MRLTLSYGSACSTRPSLQHGRCRHCIGGVRSHYPPPPHLLLEWRARYKMFVFYQVALFQLGIRVLLLFDPTKLWPSLRTWTFEGFKEALEPGLCNITERCVGLDAYRR